MSCAGQISAFVTAAANLLAEKCTDEELETPWVPFWLTVPSLTAASPKERETPNPAGGFYRICQ